MPNLNAAPMVSHRLKDRRIWAVNPMLANHHYSVAVLTVSPKLRVTMKKVVLNRHQSLQQKRPPKKDSSKFHAKIQSKKI